jgi:hypothetical protein
MSSKEEIEGRNNGMTFQELKEYILSKLTLEQAFDRFLESGLIHYQKLKFEKGEELHPPEPILSAASSKRTTTILN